MTMFEGIEDKYPTVETYLGSLGMETAVGLNPNCRFAIQGTKVSTATVGKSFWQGINKASKEITGAHIKIH